MAEEHDNWLSGLGMDVSGLLQSVKAKASAASDDIRNAVRSGSDTSANASQPPAAAPGGGGPSQPAPAPQQPERFLGSDSDDYKQGYQDGLSGKVSNPGARSPDARTDYEEGYAKGKYDGVGGSSQAPSDSNQGGGSTSWTDGGSSSYYSKLPWDQLLPDAHGLPKGKGAEQIAHVDLHTSGNPPMGTGKDPSLTYSDTGIQTSQRAAAMDEAAWSAARDAAISKIIAARAKIPDRPIGQPKIHNKAGYDYNPDDDPAAGDYRKWAASALPAGVKATDWNWLMFKSISDLEGQEGRFTTYDTTLSVGPGNSTAGGQTQQVIGKTFKLLPEVERVAFEAGLKADAGGAMSVVDTDRKWILQGQDAAAYIQTDKSLLSLLVNVSQGAQPTDQNAGGSAIAPDEQAKQRQALLEAEWSQFLGGTLSGITSMVKGWPFRSAVLAVHAKHALPNVFGYDFWTSENSPALPKMVAAIYKRGGKVWGEAICEGQFGPPAS